MPIWLHQAGLVGLAGFIGAILRSGRQRLDHGGQVGCRDAIHAGANAET